MTSHRGNGHTYRAFYEDSGEVIYKHLPNGNLFGELPHGTSCYSKGHGGTIERADDGDWFERARFRARTGRAIVVERERADGRAHLAGRKCVRFAKGNGDGRGDLYLLRDVAGGWDGVSVSFGGWGEFFQEFAAVVTGYGTDEHGEWWSVEGSKES